MTSCIASGMLSGIASNTKEDTMSEESEKVRENRLRRMADRQGLKLVKSRRRDPRALDYGTYALVAEGTNEIVWTSTQDTPGHPEFALDFAERFLKGEEAYDA
jgi:hypothetical protein